MSDIEFPFYNQDEMVRSAVRLLAEVQPPQCCCLVVPPGFGASVVASQVARRLRGQMPRPLLAEIEADAVVDARHFVTELHSHWLDSLALALDVSLDEARKSLPDPSSSLAPHKALKALLDSLPTDRPVIAVLDRFHKILDRLDQWVLAQLRATEEKRRLRTVAVTPLHYTELKKRWREDHPLTVSDYGDKHAVFKAEPGLLEFAQERCRQLGVPDHLARYMLGVAGGYPEPMIAMLEEWQRRGRTKDLRPEIKRAYRDAAERRVERLIDWLDVDKKDAPFRGAVIDLYQGADEERAGDLLSGHPYEPLLLDSDGGLRAECVGGAAVRVACQGVVDKHATGRRLYERRQYAQVRALLDGPEPPPNRLAQRVLQTHARVMAVLYDEEGTETGLDTEWKKLKDQVTAARKSLEPVRKSIADFARIEERYDGLERLAAMVLKVAEKNTAQIRVVDALAGMQGDAPASAENRNCAFLVIIRQAEIARALPGTTNSCLAALALPEQIFRVWAFCHMGLNYYKAPTADDIWKEAEKHWPARYDTLKRAEPGEEFPSLVAFAYFALAQCLQVHCGDAASAIENDYSKLQSSLSQWNQVRTAPAHAMVVTTREEKDRYFRLIDRWLDRALTVCCPGETRQGLLAVYDPLPLVDDDGNFSGKADPDK